MITKVVESIKTNKGNESYTHQICKDGNFISSHHGDVLTRKVLLWIQVDIFQFRYQSETLNNGIAIGE